MTRPVIRFDSDFSSEAERGARAALAASGVRQDAIDQNAVASPTGEDGFTVEQIRAQAQEDVRNMWQQPGAESREDSMDRAAMVRALQCEDPSFDPAGKSDEYLRGRLTTSRSDDSSFSVHDARRQSQESARNAWRS